MCFPIEAGRSNGYLKKREQVNSSIIAGQKNIGDLYGKRKFIVNGANPKDITLRPQKVQYPSEMFKKTIIREPGKNRKRMRKVLKRYFSSDDALQATSLPEIYSGQERGQSLTTLLELRNYHHSRLSSMKKLSRARYQAVKGIKNLQIAEQLTTLYHLSMQLSEGYDTDDVDLLMKMGIGLAQQQDIDLLGRFLYLVNLDFPKNWNLKITNQSHLKAWVDSRFGEAVSWDTMRNKIYKWEALHEKTGIQCAEEAGNILLAKMLAEGLILKDGSLNFGLIARIEEEFLPPFKRSHHDTMRWTLRAIASSAELRNRIMRTGNLKDLGGRGQFVVGCALQKHKKNDRSDRDASQAILSALLSYPRQGSIGSCFATSLTIQTKSSNLGQCVQDFDDLLRKEELSRWVDGKLLSFPYLLKMPQGDLKKKISLSKGGTIEGKGEKIWRVPGIREAYRSMGITGKQTKQRILEVLEALSVRDELKDISIGKFIHECAAAFKTDEVLKCGDDAADRMKFAFGSLTSHPLLKVWDNSVAGMSEARLTGKMKKKVIGSTFVVLKSRLARLGKDKVRDQLILSAIAEEFTARGELLYDPDFAYQYIKKSGYRSKGAFVLYDNKGRANPDEWKRIDNPSHYLIFVKSLIKSSILGVNQLELKNSVKKEVVEIMKQLAAFARLSEFGDMAIRVLNYQKSLKDPLKRYEEHDRTPWVGIMGNRTPEVVAVYHENKAAAPLEFQPCNAMDLLANIIERAQELGEEQKRLLEKNAQYRLLVRTHGCHAFSLCFGEEKIQQILNREVTLRDWIDANMVAPVKGISHSCVDAQTRNKIYLACSYLISQENSDSFKEYFSAIDSTLLYPEFRNTLLKCFQRLKKRRGKEFAQLKKEVDEILFSTLDQEMRQTVEKGLVKFADSNWIRKGRDVKFAFVYNPFSEILELILVEDETQTINTLDQNKWITDRSWIFYTQH